MANKQKNLKGLLVKIGGMSFNLSDDKRQVYYAFKWRTIVEEEGFRFIEMDKPNRTKRYLDNE